MTDPVAHERALRCDEAIAREQRALDCLEGLTRAMADEPVTTKTQAELRRAEALLVERGR